MNTLREGVAVFLFPHHCVFCGEVVTVGRYVCENCEPILIDDDACPYCALPEIYCRCRKRAHFFDEITAVYMYDDMVRYGILRYKSGANRRMAGYMAKKMAETAKKKGYSIDAVAYVPQTRRERWHRGFYLNREIAGQLAQELELPLYDGLVKIFDAPAQKEMGFLFRRGNIAGAFDVRDPEEVKGKRFLLADDIKTTGETLDECAKMLKLYDADAVYALTFAVAHLKRKEKEKENAVEKKKE